jgi:hypothetical protein
MTFKTINTLIAKAVALMLATALGYFIATAVYHTILFTIDRGFVYIFTHSLGAKYNTTIPSEVRVTYIFSFVVAGVAFLLWLIFSLASPTTKRKE